jgi:PKD repeat protein
VPSTRDFWHLNRTSGRNMQDATGRHPGTLHDVARHRDGFTGAGFGFNGRSSYVTVPTSAELNAGNRDVHVTFSMKTASVPDEPDYDLFRKGEAPGPEYKVEMQPNGQISCHFTGSRGAVTVQDGPDLHDGKWHTVSCDKLSDRVVLTVDGTTYSKSKTVGSISNGYDVIIGAYPRGDFYEGVLDEISFSTGADAVTPPTASFTEKPASGYAPRQVSFTDTSRGRPTRRHWDFGDHGASDHANPTHLFREPGSYPVELRVRNALGTATATHTVTFEKARDTTAPRVRLLRPGARRSSVAAWRILHGRASDGSGSGVHHVTLRVIERRHGHWFAYRPSTRAWVRAATRARAWHRAGASRVVPASTRRFHERLGGLRHGRLEIRFSATDDEGNESATHLVTRRLHRRG